MATINLRVDDCIVCPVRADESSLPSAVVYDPIAGWPVTETSTRTTSTVEGQHMLRLLDVVDATTFPDQPGHLCIGLGYEYQTAPVPYIGRASSTQLLIDPTFQFPYDIPAGAYVNLLTGAQPKQPEHPEQGAFYVTPSPAGRVACAKAIDDLAAAGIEVRKTVRYPSDVGLGNAGAPTSGAERLSDVVWVYGGDDLDTELDQARAQTPARRSVT